VTDIFPSAVTDDPATDARESGNNAEALLKGDGSVVTQMMGLEYGSPKPYLPEDKLNLPKFMAKDSMESSVNPQGEEPVFKHIGTSNGNWAPNDSQSQEDRWDQVPKLWKEKASDQKQVVDTMTAEMGWDEAEFAEWGTPELLLDDKRFLDLYLAAPMITVA